MYQVVSDFPPPRRRTASSATRTATTWTSTTRATTTTASVTITTSGSPGTWTIWTQEPEPGPVLTVSRSCQSNLGTTFQDHGLPWQLRAHWPRRMGSDWSWLWSGPGLGLLREGGGRPRGQNVRGLSRWWVRCGVITCSLPSHTWLLMGQWWSKCNDWLLCTWDLGPHIYIHSFYRWVHEGQVCTVCRANITLCGSRVGLCDGHWAIQNGSNINLTFNYKTAFITLCEAGCGHQHIH